MHRFTRRSAMAAVGGLAFSRQGTAQSGKYPRNMSKADLDRMMAELSNWGKWGDDAAAGTTNLISPANAKPPPPWCTTESAFRWSLMPICPKRARPGGHFLR